LTPPGCLAIIYWTEIDSDGLLLEGEVLPGFELPLAQLFARIEGLRDE